MKEFSFEKVNANRYFGKEYEFDLVGGVDRENPSYQADLKAKQSAAVARGYRPRQADSLPFREALELSKKFQPGDPTNPRKAFAKTLRLALAEKLGVKPDEQKNIKIFTSIGGPLDAHGIDGFISYVCPIKDGQEKEFMVSFDITKNPDKDAQMMKADLLIGGDIPDSSDEGYNEEKYSGVINNYAAEMAGILQNKIKDHQERYGGIYH